MTGESAQHPSTDPAGDRPAPSANAGSGGRTTARHPAAPTAAPRRRIHLVGNAHLDPVWLWPWQEGYAEARSTFWSAIHRMEEDPDFVFSCDQVVLLSWVKEADPVLFDRIREREAQGRWVNVGGWWVEPDCNLPMGESFVRQGLYGQRFLLAEFGRAATVGMNVDPFGHQAMIPAILRGQGMDTYTFLRPGPHEADLHDRPFWWQAPDGSRVLAARIPYEYCSPPGDIAHQLEKGLAQLDRSFGPLLAFYGVGDHGGGPTRANLASIHRYQAMGTFGELIMSSPRDFFDEVLAGTADDLPTWTGDLQHHAAGCYSAHSGIKAWQRRAQHAVLQAERWAVIAHQLGAAINAALSYPRGELESAWKQVLFNQFHDLLPGSAIAPGFEDARDQLGEAVAISKRIVTRCHNVIARQIDIPLVEDTQPVVVFNSHPWPVTATMKINYSGLPDEVTANDADGQPVPTQRVAPTAVTGFRSRGALIFTAELPALGYRLYRLGGGRPPQAGELTVSVGTDGRPTLQNRRITAVIDPESGWLASLVDRDSGIDVAGRGDHLQLCADPTDTWGHRVVSYAWPGAGMPVTAIRIAEQGPVRVAVEVDHAWGRSTLTERFSLTPDADALRVDVDLDWQEPAHLLKLRFPVAVDDPQATYEIPYATLERPVDGAEEPAQSWVDLSGQLRAGDRRGGLIVINDAKHGYDVSPAGTPTAGSDPSIGVTAVRSPVYAWHDPQPLEPDRRYHYQALGRQEFSCLLVPHTGDWRSRQPTRRAAELGAAPRAMLEGFHDGHLPGSLSFVEVITRSGDGAVVATAVKGAEDDSAPDTQPDTQSDTQPGTDVDCDLVVRVSETVGRPATAEIRMPLLGRTVTTELGPYQLRTFRIPADPDRPVTETDLIERRDRRENAEQPFRAGTCDRVERLRATDLII